MNISKYTNLIQLQFVIGQRVKYPTICDLKLSNDIYNMRNSIEFPVIQGKTMCTDDFYEGTI